MAISDIGSEDLPPRYFFSLGVARHALQRGIRI